MHRVGRTISSTPTTSAFDYVRRFTEWKGSLPARGAGRLVRHVHAGAVQQELDGIAFGEERASQLIEKLIATFGDERKVTITELRSVDDTDLTEVADFITRTCLPLHAEAVGMRRRRWIRR